MGSKSAFDAKRGTVFYFDPEELVLVEDKTDPLYDQRVTEKVNERLVKNIMFEGQGVLEPVIIRKVGEQAVVVDGRQRVKAAREANRRLVEAGNDPLTVPAVLRRGDDKAMFGVMIATNEHRLDDNLMVKADKVARFLNQGGTEVEAAVAFGVSRQTITNWLRMLDLDEEVKRHVSQGKLSASAAAELHSLPRDEQKAKAAEMVAVGAKTVESAREVARGGKPTERKPKVKSRKEIQAAVDGFEEAPAATKEAARALRWVLGQVKTPW